MLKMLTERYIAAFSQKDIKSISALLDEKFVLEDPVVKRVEGRSAALEAISKIFDSCEKLNFRAKKIYQDKDSSIIEFVLVLDGVVLEGVDIIDWKDGLMCELRAYLDIPKD